MPNKKGPKTKPANRMKLPSSSQDTHECTLAYTGVQKQVAEKV